MRKAVPNRMEQRLFYLVQDPTKQNKHDTVWWGVAMALAGTILGSRRERGSFDACLKHNEI
jgi:hypothetical protein